MTGATGARHRFRRLGLRTRVTLLFAVGSMAVSVALAAATYATARQFLVHQGETSIEHQAFVNGSLILADLRSPRPNLPQDLLNLDNGPNTDSVVSIDGKLFASSVTGRSNPVSPSLQALVSHGTPATQFTLSSGAPALVVGVPLPSVNAIYYEISSLDQAARTLRFLLLTLALGALVMTIAGAVVGRWASGRVLRPLANVAQAAADLAGGELGTRLDTSGAADLSRLAASFNRMADNLQARIEREARFTSDVSHELRSPLTTLSAALGVLDTHRDEMPERSRKALDLLDAEVHRFEAMVADLLEISRFDSGVAELSLEEVEAGELLHEALRAITARTRQADSACEAGIPVETTAGAERLRLLIDKRRIERVIANLVDNAHTYGDGVRRLVIEAPDPAHVRFVVEDRGPGVRQDERLLVFERFYRGDASRSRGGTEGTGLGLSLVAEHVHLHGGSVWIEDAPDGGARFVVELPRGHEQVPGPSSEQTGTRQRGRKSSPALLGTAS